MNKPTVSTIIPAHNGAGFLAETIQSVLDQTYQNFELIIVNDASKDHTDQVVKQFDDERIKYIVHEQNRGSNATRNTGVQAATGEIIAFLDQDDLLHPEKFEAHVAFFQAHPDVGITYNARFDLNHSTNTIRAIWRPPKNVTLADLVVGFPFSPSDMMLRREWELQGGSWDDNLFFNGSEYIIWANLIFAGCKFAMVDRTLNYRRYHSGRIIRNLRGGCEAELNAQDKVLSDPRCPAEVTALRKAAFLNTYLEWSYKALAQEETPLAQEFIGKIEELKPNITAGTPCEFAIYLIERSIRDDTRDLDTFLPGLFAQLPPGMLKHPKRQCNWALGQGYLLKGTRAIMWERLGDGDKFFTQAIKHKAQIDEAYLRKLTGQLIDYEFTFDTTAVQKVRQRLNPYLEKIGGKESVRWLNGCYSINQAFHQYKIGEYSKVPNKVMRAIINNPTYLINRGVLAILLRSLIGKQSRLSPITISSSK